jgi:hypothetical protein
MNDRGEEKDMKSKKMKEIQPKAKEEIKKEDKDEKKVSKRIFIGSSVDGELWKRLRALAIKQGTTAGPMLDKAIEGYLAKKE